MSTLKEFLKQFEGKSIGAQLIVGGELIGVGGEVVVTDGEVTLLRKRRIVEGQPIMTQMGPQVPKQAIPESILYLGDLPLEALIFIEVPTETGEEAMRQLEAGAKSLIQVPKMAAPPGMGGGSGFVPQVR